MAEERVNIAKIAEIAKVGKATVSRVLNNKEHVSPKTAKLVREVCEQLNYKPNFFAQNLMSVRSGIIGLFFEPGNAEYYKYYGDLMKGCILEAYKYGMNILPYYSPNVADMEKALFPGGSPLAGALICAPRIKESRLLQFKKYGIPVTIIGVLYGEDKDYVSVDINNRKLVYECLLNFFENGHKTIGFINSNPELTITAERDKAVKGFLKTYKEVVLSERWCKDKEGEAIEQISSIIAEQPETTAFLVNSDIVARDLYEYFTARGKTIGKDISVIALGGTKYTNTLNPKLTHAEQDYVNIGSAAINLIKQQLEENIAFCHKRYDSNFINGESVANLNNK